MPTTKQIQIPYPMLTEERSTYTDSWNGNGAHPDMPPSCFQTPSAPAIDHGVRVFSEYLTYASDTPEPIKAFVSAYPWLLTEPLACIPVIANHCCYHGLKKLGWWDTMLTHVTSVDRIGMWLKRAHVLALAYDTSDIEVSKINWNSWKSLVQEHGPYYADINDPNPFSRAKALMLLANRINTQLAALMCASMQILLPFDTLDRDVAHQWTPLQKSQYAWAMMNTLHPEDIWPIRKNARIPLMRTQIYLGQYAQLADPQSTMNLAILYELCNSDVERTVSELIQIVQKKPCVYDADSLDYTQAL